MRSKAKSTIAFVLAGILLAACIGAAGLLLQGRSAATSFNPSPVLDAEDAEDGFPAVDWDFWQGVNPDVVGWVTVPGTSIDYPIVQAHANAPAWYLNHDVYGNWNIYGCPYLDADCEEEGFGSQVAYVFAHHMDDGSMFAPLASLDPGECREILLQTPEERMRLEVCAVDVVNAWSEMKQVEFPSDAAFQEWIRDVPGSADTVTETPENVASLKAFVTCSYNYWSNERTVVYSLECGGLNYFGSSERQ